MATRKMTIRRLIIKYNMDLWTGVYILHQKLKAKGAVKAVTARMGVDQCENHEIIAEMIVFEDSIAISSPLLNS